MPHVTPNTDVDDEAIEDLLSQYQQPRIQKLIRSMIGDAGVKELEVDFGDLHDYHVIENAQGEQLDQWGRVVGQPRGGLDDAEYRGFIQARILANQSEGRRRGLIEAMSKLPDVPGYSAVDVELSGLSNTVVPAGARLEDATGDVWALQSDTTIPGTGTFHSTDGYAHAAIEEIDTANGNGVILKPVQGWSSARNPVASISGVRYRDHFPAACSLEVRVLGTWDAALRRRVVQLFDDIRPAGVRLSLLQLPDGPFLRLFKPSTTSSSAVGHRLDEGGLARVLNS
ncbi:MAG: hypothetical protein ABEN55_19700 [Bradymonadaceae bacterium]